MKKLSLVIGFIVFACTIQAQEIGVQLYTFREQFKKDVKGTIEMIHKMGIKEIEGGGTYGMDKNEYKKLLDVNELKMVSVGADFGQLLKDPQAIIDEAKFFGATYVMCAWVPHNGAFTIDDAKKAVEVFNTAGKLFKDNGLTFCYHAHGYEFRPYEDGTLFDYMAKNMNASFANFEMDVYWIKNPGQDPVALLKKYPGRFKLMHLKDRKPGTPNNQNGEQDVETNVVLGQGDVGIAAIMKIAKQAGVEHYFIEDESSRSVEQVPESLKYLKTLKM
jgi:sugar phosphate isomerase/epimerase